jgi:tetratricopeptide (TPR) repeat protein
LCYSFGDYQGSINFGKKVVEYYTYSNPTYLCIAYSYSKLKDKSNALIYFERAINTGSDDLETIQKDKDLENIRQYPEFKALMRKYFPTQYKE